MRGIYLTGRHAARFLLSKAVLDLDSEFYARRGAPETLNFMECLEGLVSLPVLEGLPSAAPAISRQEAQDIAEWLGVETPLQVAVQELALRRNSNRLACSKHPEGIPQSQYFQFDGELYCASPELALLEYARTAEAVQVIVLASLLQSIFFVDDGGRLLPRRPLTTQARIMSLYDRIASSGAKMPKGLLRIPELIGYSVERAASPKEIETALRLGLPLEMGGCGLGMPEMNYAVRIGTSRRQRYCDLCWPAAGIAVEYDSAAEHTGAGALEADALHRNDLVSAGMRVYTMTAGQLSDLQLLDRPANQIRVDAGLGPMPRQQGFAAKQRALQSAIASALPLQ